MLRVCIDTNVWISGVLFEGAPQKIIRLAIRKAFTTIMSDVILDELQRNLIRKFGYTPYKVKFLLRQIRQISDVYEPRGTVKPTFRTQNLRDSASNSLISLN